jgi:crossover junction endonuclease EME1
LNTSFCMAPGQVSTGINRSDTFLKMLQEINRVTAPIAYGVAGEYDSATKLVEGFEVHGKDMLMDIRKSANKDGAVSDRTVGKSISRRLCGIFMSRDEGSHDV